VIRQDIDHFSANPTPTDLNGPVEENPEYALIVAANNLSVDCENELLIVHKVSLPFPRLICLLSASQTLTHQIQRLITAFSLVLPPPFAFLRSES
jgi:hypothetical protein